MYRKAATILRSARDTMNHGGKHWIKGDMQQEIGYDAAMEAYDDAYNAWLESGSSDPEPEEPDYMDEWGYCSAGGINVVTTGDAENYPTTPEAIVAIEAFCKVVNPKKYAKYEEDCKKAWSFGSVGYGEGCQCDVCRKVQSEEGTSFEEWMHSNSGIDYRVEYLYDNIVIPFNDDKKTRWEDVRNAFTTAARNLARRKG